MSKILTYPNPLLEKIAEPVLEFKKCLYNITKTMLELLYEYEGIGLAAPQIGILKRIFVLDLQEEGKKSPKVFINPEIIDTGGVTNYEEGCLSIPNIRASITRKNWVVVDYQDVVGKKQQLKLENLGAICVQHEIDHLNGILFWNHLSPLKKKFLMTKYKKNL